MDFALETLLQLEHFFTNRESSFIFNPTALFIVPLSINGTTTFVESNDYSVFPTNPNSQWCPTGASCYLLSHNGFVHIHLLLERKRPKDTKISIQLFTEGWGLLSFALY